MEPDVLKFLEQHKIPYQETRDFETVLPHADVLYMTRLQEEHDVTGESQRIDRSSFQLGVRHLKKIKPSAVILDPLPRHGETEIGVDEDSRALYWEQERNGLWMRAALIALLFRVQDAIFKGSR
jgi:aspartate carbamoyltransferase catalytic subunit